MVVGDHDVGSGVGQSRTGDRSKRRLDVSERQEGAPLVDTVLSVQQEVEEEMLLLESEFEEGWY